VVRREKGGGDAKRTNLGLSVLSEYPWCDLVNLANQLEHWVIWEMGLEERKLEGIGTSGYVCLPQRMCVEPCSGGRSFGERRGHIQGRLGQT
jgi:hypothetical protein